MQTSGPQASSSFRVSVRTLSGVFLTVSFDDGDSGDAQELGAHNGDTVTSSPTSSSSSGAGAGAYTDADAATVGALKRKIARLLPHVPTRRQRLIYCGQELLDDGALLQRDCSIASESCLHLVEIQDEDAADDDGRTLSIDDVSGGGGSHGNTKHSPDDAIVATITNNSSANSNISASAQAAAAALHQQWVTGGGMAADASVADAMGWTLAVGSSGSPQLRHLSRPYFFKVAAADEGVAVSSSATISSGGGSCSGSGGGDNADDVATQPRHQQQQRHDGSDVCVCFCLCEVRRENARLARVARRTQFGDVYGDAEAFATAHAEDGTAAEIAAKVCVHRRNKAALLWVGDSLMCVGRGRCKRRSSWSRWSVVVVVVVKVVVVIVVVVVVVVAAAVVAAAANCDCDVLRLLLHGDLGGAGGGGVSGGGWW
jgi:hypothetical protein